MGAIDVGESAIDRAGAEPVGSYTYVQERNAANRSGKITSVEMFFSGDVTGVKVGIFSGSAGTFTCRDYASIGAVSGGSKQTASVDIDVIAGDFIGIYFEGAGKLESAALTGETNTLWRYSGDAVGAGETSFDGQGRIYVSLYGIGYAHDGSVMRGGFNGMRGGFIN